MANFRIFRAICLAFCLYAMGHGELERLLYSLPKLAPTHLRVYDIDDNHKLVREIPIAKDHPMHYVRGIAASKEAGKLWVSYWEDFFEGETKVQQDRNILAFDLLQEKVLWKKTYGITNVDEVDRLDVTPDGKKLYAPLGEGSHTNSWRVIDATDGKVLKTLSFGNGKGPHNTIVNLAGDKVYCGSVGSGDLVIVDTKTDEVVKRVGRFERDTGNKKPSIRPFTVNSDESLAFSNVNNLMGFVVGDIKTGKVIYVAHAKRPPAHEISNPDYGKLGHGIALTPDDKEVWVIDPQADLLHAFDVTEMPPKQIASVKLTSKPGFNQWINTSLDGRYVYPQNGDVIDRTTMKVTDDLRKVPGAYEVHDMLIEIHKKDGKIVRVGKQFGIGYPGTQPVNLRKVLEEKAKARIRDKLPTGVAFRADGRQVRDGWVDERIYLYAE